eukprot:COSAG01_NODE_24450_length_778_cov_2.089838_2_plen_46_part_01
MLFLAVPRVLLQLYTTTYVHVDSRPGAPSSYVEKTRSDTLLRVSRW